MYVCVCVCVCVFVCSVCVCVCVCVCSSVVCVCVCVYGLSVLVIKCLFISVDIQQPVADIIMHIHCTGLLLLGIESENVLHCNLLHFFLLVPIDKYA